MHAHVCDGGDGGDRGVCVRVCVCTRMSVMVVTVVVWEDAYGAVVEIALHCCARV